MGLSTYNGWPGDFRERRFARWKKDPRNKHRPGDALNIREHKYSKAWVPEKV